MHIALVTNDIDFGSDERIPSGMSVYTRGLAEALIRVGHKVSVLIPVQEDSVKKSYWDGDDVPAVVPLIVSRRLGTLSGFMEFGSAVHEWCTINRPDVIEAHQFEGTLFVEQALGGVPTVVRYASDTLDSAAVGGISVQKVSRSGVWDKHLLEILTVKNADLVLCGGSRQAARADALGAKLMLELPLGIDDFDYTECPLTERAKSHVLVLVTRFDDPRKGGEFVYPILSSIPPEYTVSIVGELDQSKRMALLEGAPRRPGVVNWIFDPLTTPDLHRLMDDTCATIVPTKSESFGLSLLQPMAFGRPTICFVQNDPTKREWPLWNLGPASAESCRSIRTMLKTASDPPKSLDTDLVKFAAQYKWSALVDRYVQAYERAAASALISGRTRGW